MATPAAPTEQAGALQSTNVEAMLQVRTGQNALAPSTQKAQDHPCPPSAPGIHKNQYHKSYNHSQHWKNHPEVWKTQVAGAEQHKATSCSKSFIPTPPIFGPPAANHSSSHPQASYNNVPPSSTSMINAPALNSAHYSSTLHGQFLSQRETNQPPYRSLSADLDPESQKFLWQYEHYTTPTQQSAPQRTPGSLPHSFRLLSSEPLRSIEWGANWVEATLSEELNRMYRAYRASIEEVRKQLAHEQDEKESLRKRAQELEARLEVELKRLHGLR